MFSENLAALRKMHGYTQERLAEQLGISRQTLSKWETGESLPDIESGKKLADLFEVSLSELVEYDETKTGMSFPPKGKHAFGIVKVGDKGQIVLPAKARKVFDIQPGDNLLVFGDENSGIAILKEKDLINLLNLGKT